MRDLAAIPPEVNLREHTYTFSLPRFGVQEDRQCTWTAVALGFPGTVCCAILLCCASYMQQLNLTLHVWQVLASVVVNLDPCEAIQLQRVSQ